MFNNTVKKCLLTYLIAVCIVSINVPYPDIYPLHQMSTVIFVTGLLIIHKRYNISSSAWLWSTGFVMSHILGARYIYSFVPYDQWFQSLFSVSLQEMFHWQRNMYDRLVHFCFGLFLFPFMLDVCKRIFHQVPTKHLIIIVLMFNMSCSMLYELFEWLIAVVMSPDNAEAYNGQQGDMWDAHKDMGLALVGAMVSAILYKTKS